MDLIENDLFYDNSINRHPWELARLQVLIFLMKKNFQNTQNIHFIDIGCGDGFIIRKISEEFDFKSIIAFDPELSARQLKKLNQLNSNIEFSNNLHEIELHQDEPYVLSMFDVLEHIEFDKEFLNKLHLKFKNISFQLFLTVPSYNFLFSKHDKFLQHYRRYSAKSLTRTLNESNFRISKNGYFFVSLLVLRVLTTFFEKIFYRHKTQNLGIGNWGGNKRITLFITRILIIDFKISNYLNQLDIKLPGLSNYAICKKLQ